MNQPLCCFLEACVAIWSHMAAATASRETGAQSCTAKHKNDLRLVKGVHQENTRTVTEGRKIVKCCLTDTNLNKLNQFPRLKHNGSLAGHPSHHLGHVLRLASMRAAATALALSHSTSKSWDSCCTALPQRLLLSNQIGGAMPWTRP